MRRFWQQPEKSSVAITVVAALVAFVGVEALSRHHPTLAYAVGGIALFCLVIVLFFSEGEKR